LWPPRWRTRCEDRGDQEGRPDVIGAAAAFRGVTPADVLRLLMLRLPAILTCGPMGASYMTLWTLAVAGGG
jgi:hypothetical protein